MQLLNLLLASASVVQAHYNFNALIYGGTTQPTWQQVRKRSNSDSHGPVTDVSSLDLRCGTDASTAYAPGIQTVAAGQNISFVIDPDVQHPGPGMGYLAKVPSGKTAANWDGSGSVWFKVWEIGATSFDSNGGKWPTSGLTTLGFPIPKDTPSGDYLARIEHIGLHSASQPSGAQFYLSCAQITITGGGSGVPGPLVAFPGAYKATDPGILFQIYYPIPTSYTIPGPKVWTGGDSGSGSDTGGGAATTVATGPTSTAASGGTTTSAVSTGPTVPKYGQCGGSGWTGGTKCASGSTCTSSSTYYWQCL